MRSDAESTLRQYWVPPSTLLDIGEAIGQAFEETGNFAAVCHDLCPLIAQSKVVRGVENIPLEGPIVVVKNHPCHFDLLLLEELYRLRPEVRILLKRSGHTEHFPVELSVMLEKKGPKASPEDIKVLQSYLRSGGSLLATPWGSLDHQAKEYATPERAARNAVRYAQFAGARVLPIYITQGYNTTATNLPLGDVEVHYLPSLSPSDTVGIERVIADMYRRATLRIGQQPNSH